MPKWRSVSAPTGQTAMHIPQLVQSGLVRSWPKAGLIAASRLRLSRFDGGDADDLIADPGTAVAHDATIPFVIDEIAEVHIWLRELGTPIWVGIDVVEVGVVLEIALARFVAGWAVERVIDQVHLQDELPGIDDRLGVGKDLHAFAERGSTRLDQAAALAKNFDRTNTARSPWAHQWLIAEVREPRCSPSARLRESLSRRERSHPDR